MSCTVSLVHKVAKYVKLVLELVRPCKYGASIRIQTYIQPVWRANVAVAQLSVSKRRWVARMWGFFYTPLLTFYLIDKKAIKNTVC